MLQRGLMLARHRPMAPGAQAGLTLLEWGRAGGKGQLSR
ncbi:hypothetical protein B194_5084 [Serratia plymuthica A30]|nr:hypothetical protein B194_5084 [Serratia plymuthica A30]